MSKSKLNKPLIRKMIKRLTEIPESFDQNAAWAARDKRSPCGTVACLAGEAIICSASTVKEGIRLAMSDNYPDPTKLMGLPEDHGLFACAAMDWPEPFQTQYHNADGDQKKEARAAIDLLKAILKTDGKILDAE